MGYENEFVDASGVDTISSTKPATPRNWKPWILRLPSLLALLLATLLFIGLTEYALHALPSANSQGLVGDVMNVATNVKRQYESTVVTEVRGTQETLIVTYAPPPCGPTGTTATETVVCAPPPQYWLPVGTATVKALITATPLISTSTFTLIPTSTETPGAPAPEYWLSIPVLTNSRYFIGAFLSTIIAVLFAIPWVVIDARVRSLEPFHQCTKANGASAAETLYIDYGSPFFLFAPMKALYHGHWAPLATSLLTNITVLVTCMAPEFVFVRLEGSCDASHTGCTPSLSVYPLAGRILEALLGIMAILAIFLIVIMSRYSSGVFSEPHSIAGLAALANNQELRNDFRQALSAISGTRKIAYKPLAKKKYRLDVYRDADGSVVYGFAPGHTYEYQIPSGVLWDTVQIHEFQPAQPLSTSHPHRRFSLLLMALLSGLAVLIVYYKLVYSPTSGFEKFMDSQGFGVRFLFTFVGVVISRLWSTMFKDISSMQAFSNLSHRSIKAQDSIVLPKLFHPLSALFPLLFRGQAFAFLVAFSAFLAEPLTICLANIHFKSGTTFAAFTVSTWLSCAIIAVMLITLVGIAFHKEPNMPFKPDTIAATLYYLASSSLPVRFKGMEMMDTKSRNRAIREMDLRYGMWMRGTDGVVVIDVDSS